MPNFWKFTVTTLKEQMAKVSPGGKKPDPDPDPEPRRTTDPMAGKRVKDRVEKLNQRSQNSPGKFPESKQSLI